MSRHAVRNLIALALAVMVALGLSIPVFDAAERGQRLVELGLSSPRERLHSDGLGPLSGMMLFVLAAPVLIASASTLKSKLVVVLMAAGAALALSRITTLFQSGHTVAAWSLIVAVTLVAAAAVGLEHLAARRRRRQVAAMARRVAAIVHEAAVAVRAEGKGDRAAAPSSPVAVPRMVRSMALAVVWQAAVNGRPETFERAVRRDLADLRRDLGRNRALDPDGRGLMMLDRVQRRLAFAVGGAGAEARRRDQRGPRVAPGARRRPVPRLGDHSIAARSGDGSG